MDIKVGTSTGKREDDSAAINKPPTENSVHSSQPVYLGENPNPDSFARPLDAAFEPIPETRSASGQADHITGDPISRLFLISLPFLIVLVFLFYVAWKSVGPRVDGVIPLTGQQEQARLEKDYIKPGNLVAGSSKSQPAAGNNGLCAMPLGWISHRVEPTESLFRLALQYNVTPEQLQAANCMGDETMIMPGQTIFVPPLPADPPTPTPEPTATPTTAPTRVPYIPLTGENLPVTTSNHNSDDEPSQPAAPVVQPPAQPDPPVVVPTNPPPQPTIPPPSVRPADPPPNKPVPGGGGNGGGQGKGKIDNNNGKGKGGAPDGGSGKGNGGGKAKDNGGKTKGKGKGGK